MTTRSRLPRWLLLLSVLLAMVAATTLGAAPDARADYPNPDPGDPVCGPSWVVISAYGTEEDTTHQGAGMEWGSSGVNSWFIAGIVQSLHDKGVQDQAIKVRNLKYPASLISRPLPGGLPDYWTGLGIGRDRLAGEVNFYAGCANHPHLILLGYSMGAHVVKSALQLPVVQSHADTIGAVLTVADPSRNNGQIGMAQAGAMLTINPDFSTGTSAVADGGLLGRLNVPGAFAGFIGDGRYFDVCRTDDHVCNRPGPPSTDDLVQQFAYSLPAHTQYGAGDHGATANRMAAKAVSTAVSFAASGGSDPNPNTPCAPHTDTDPMGAAAIAAACSVIAQDTWYTWGGGHSVSPPQATFGSVDRSDPVRSANDPFRKGFDCSGYVRFAYYKAAGYDIIGDRTADSAYRAPWSVRFGPPMGESVLRAGDIVYFGTSASIHHTAVYLGTGLIAEAPQSNEKIRVSPMSNHHDYMGAVRPSGSGSGGGGGVGGPNSTWGTDVRTHTTPSTSGPVYTTLSGPTAIRIDCQKHAQSVTAEGYTNDVWSHLPDIGGSWVSNIYVRGPAWLPNIPACDGSPPGAGAHSTWGTNVNIRAIPSAAGRLVTTLAGPTDIDISCQKHAESVTASGITNDAWSFLPNYNGWASNIFVKGAAWLVDVPTCGGGSGGAVGGDHMTWGTNVYLHTAPTATSERADLLPGPTAVTIDCQVHGQSVTAEGITNDGWSHLADRQAWISNIYVKGAAWLDGVPACDGDPGSPGGETHGNTRTTWGTNVRVHQDATSASGVVTTLAGPTQVTVVCQKHSESVTADGYTNDGWSRLADQQGWISNIYIKGPAWDDSLPTC
ncbi:NlpC/P60 family protein [Streptomyces sp. RKAG293]|uniref:NlpC/P60 family protein n=1 Tax=Streptomyces sp. RKAG293 TaxID=2893403 RepID=UPI002034343B|nr:NlpC/P60 family protein [Streptomyces sp. RKAG293]MCM2417309.1 NlpC/P60 family protein [Streptomyces sp. RKAG293]